MRVWLTVSLLVALVAFVGGLLAGGQLATRGPAGAGAGLRGAAPIPQETTSPRPALRCHQNISFDSRNVPTVTQQPWNRVEAEGAYQSAKAYLDTAEAAGLFNDRGQRAVRLATAKLLEILVCGFGEETP